jgi:hypothetical protein
MAKDESIEDIVNSAQAARRDLSDLEQELQTEIDKMDFDAFQNGHDLTAAQTKRRIQLRASQSEVRDAFIALAFVTVSRLDDSSEVAMLSTRLDGINSGLSDDLGRLKKIATFATTVAKVADGVAKVAAQVVKLAAV